MRVIAVDPAPKKGGTVFDGVKYQNFKPIRLASYLEGLAEEASVLVCWDAPLTGPSDPNHPGSEDYDFTQRPIEQFFSRSATGFKAPKGISIRPYSGCPHWTISRALVGLPRVGPWDTIEEYLPFRLVAQNSLPDQKRAFIVEVHPAVAAWLWCRDSEPPKSNWDYKKEAATQTHMFEIINQKNRDLLFPKPDNDDEFDALISFILAKRWLSRDDSVILLGTRSSGSFLIPNVSNIVVRFADFLKHRPA